MTRTEADVLAVYSTPGLRRHELSRGVKQDLLREQRIPEAQIDALLTQLYPEAE